MFVISVVVFSFVWMYSMGVFIDEKKNTVKIVTGFTKQDKFIRAFSSIDHIDVEPHGVLGMYFIIQYTNHSKERIYYQFYRIYIVEKLQYKRIKKQLSKIK